MTTEVISYITEERKSSVVIIQSSIGQGSGFILQDKSGHECIVVTNSHISGEVGSMVQVTLDAHQKNERVGLCRTSFSGWERQDKRQKNDISALICPDGFLKGIPHPFHLPINPFMNRHLLQVLISLSMRRLLINVTNLIYIFYSACFFWATRPSATGPRDTPTWTPLWLQQLEESRMPTKVEVLLPPKPNCPKATVEVRW